MVDLLDLPDISVNMEDTVDKLEAMFNKTESDIDHIANKLDSEFGHGLEQQNPAAVLSKLSDIKQEYASIVKEAAAIQGAQKDAMKFFTEQLTTTCEALMKLQLQSGMPADTPDELRKVEEMLGMTGSRDTKESEGSVSPAGATNDEHVKEELGDTFVVDPIENQMNGTSQCTPSFTSLSVENLSPSERRRDTSECIEIEPEEFESVSSLIRGRVKLAEVNQIYRILWHHFKEEENSEPLSTQSMFKMGLRVTGQTGEAKLKVLRALKLLTLSKKGDVMLS